jgi:hypothetical protein
MSSVIPLDSPIDTQELSSVAKLCQTTQNPGIIGVSWANRQFLAFDDRIYIPDFNDARLKILQARHDSPLAGHPGILKTIELISCDYIWIGMQSEVKTYVSRCPVCQRTKGSKQPPVGRLKSLEVPSRPRAEISMDFIEQLPESSGFNSILVVVDRFSKWATFIPTTVNLTLASLANLLID